MFYSERATFEFVDPVRYSASDRLCQLVLQLILQLVDLMMGRGLRRCPPDHLLVTYGDTVLFFFGFPSVTPRQWLQRTRSGACPAQIVRVVGGGLKTEVNC